MKTQKGKIKVVEEWIHCFDPESDGKELATWWEIFDGTKWVGKAWSMKTAMRVSDEIKAGTFGV